MSKHTGLVPIYQPAFLKKRSKLIYVIHCDKTATHSCSFVCRPCSCIPTRRSLVCINYLSEYTNKPSETHNNGTKSET